MTLTFVAPPSTKLTSHPRAKLKLKGGRKAKAEFDFSSDSAGATFECRIDDGQFEACASPARYSLGRGKHSFAVRAVAGGATDPTPATFDFKVRKKKDRR